MRVVIERYRVVAMFALAGSLTVGVSAQGQKSAADSRMPLVSVVGCGSRQADGSWMLMNASKPADTAQVFTGTKELDAAKKTALGTDRYKLIGTAEFVTKEELLKYQQRGEFTRPEFANATGQLQNGHRLAVKGLLITDSNEKRLNLVSVQQIADTCK